MQLKVNILIELPVFRAGQIGCEEKNMGLFDKLKKSNINTDKYDFFWKTMELCDWDNEGDDELVLMPVINYLASKDDHEIFEFDNLMCELLFALDAKELAKQCEKTSGYFSDDGFLYSRCVALVNGVEYYKDALLGKHKEMWELEFESLLYVPMRAWAFKHQQNEDCYPYEASVSYETGSNVNAWK